MPGVIPRRIALAPRGLSYRTSVAQVQDVYAKQFLAELAPRYRSAAAGPETEALDRELETRKAQFVQNRFDFGVKANGLDATGVASEYSYGNGETAVRVDLAGSTHRFLFFFHDRLWKVYDEYALGETGALGDSFGQAVATAAELFGGIQPVLVPADPAKGRPFAEAQWRDPISLIRLVDRSSSGLVGMAFVDRRVDENIATYRPAKAAKDAPTATAQRR